MAAPNLKEIEWAIEELKNSESSKSNYIFLASLLRCRDELTGKEMNIDYSPQIAAYSQASGPFPVSEPLSLYGDSDFLMAVSGKDTAAAWAVMDEHMEALRIINRRAYDGIMRKLSQI